jgi:tetratricopeptide (TPR) repeat protein
LAAKAAQTAGLAPFAVRVVRTTPFCPIARTSSADQNAMQRCIFATLGILPSLWTGCVFLARVPEPLLDHVSLAADCLDKNDPDGAIQHFSAHLHAHPEQLMFRAYLAEQLFRLKRYDAARPEFEQFITEAQATTGPPREHLVHCHTRLMTIATEQNDSYREQLHRGLSLIELAEQWTEADPKAMALRKAGDALREACEQRPTCPRVQLALARVYVAQAQPESARVARERAKAAPPHSLTDAEKAALFGEPPPRK